MSHIVLQLPFPVSANRLWIRAKQGMRKSDAYKAWITEAGWLARQQKQKPIEGPYKLSILAVRPDRRKRDLGNLEKSISDLLQSVGLIRDDADCEMILARWVTTGQGVTVIVSRATTEERDPSYYSNWIPAEPAGVE